jgi:hypothetical protein
MVPLWSSMSKALLPFYYFVIVALVLLTLYSIKTNEVTEAFIGFRGLKVGLASRKGNRKSSALKRYRNAKLLS